jgi:hypothetical protein
MLQFNAHQSVKTLTFSNRTLLSLKHSLFESLDHYVVTGVILVENSTESLMCHIKYVIIVYISNKVEFKTFIFKDKHKGTRSSSPTECPYEIELKPLRE